ncbi:uncharacterized protein LOC128220289 [Mya arenaria]|uniref:uncharacterized protein LOC128220289 n=1 Tax=Mya arenaria TaxID=6604 RepID=UPI0022E7C62D|nr:uncharacterized protein LOC128220289 [Mya arenaria]XP_052784593.1 uncharacterized protein LOC128220289 [Mya arenaria]
MSRKATDVNGEETAKPLAYRDEDGNIRLYETWQEPTIWKKVELPTASKDSLDRPSSLDSQSERGSSYTEHGETYTPREPRTTSTNKQSFTSDDDLVLPVSPVLEVKEPRKRRHVMMPHDMSFKKMDQHAVRAPLVTKDNLRTLVEYLVSMTTTSVERGARFLHLDHS